MYLFIDIYIYTIELSTDIKCCIMDIMVSIVLVYARHG